VISEGSCDTENCSKDAEHSALITGINYIFKIYSHRNQIFHNVIFHIIPV